MRYCAAAYVLYLAAKALISASSVNPVNGGVGFTGNNRTLYFKGAALHFGNPKAMFLWASVFGLAAPENPVPEQIAFLFIFFLSGSICVVGVW